MKQKQNRGKQADGSPNPIDIYVGNRIKLRRLELGLTQEKLAQSISISFQQLQKYENGANRISASRLYDFSVVLGVPVGYFYENMPEKIKLMSPRGDNYSVISKNIYSETEKWQEIICFLQNKNNLKKVKTIINALYKICN